MVALHKVQRAAGLLPSASLQKAVHAIKMNGIEVASDLERLGSLYPPSLIYALSTQSLTSNLDWVLLTNHYPKR